MVAHFADSQVIPPTNLGILGNSKAPTGWTKIASPELSSTLDNYYTAGDGWLNAPLPNAPSSGYAVFPVIREGSPLEGVQTTITGLTPGVTYDITYEYLWPKGVGPYAPRFDIGFANQGYIQINGVKTYVSMHAGSGGVIDTWYCDVVSFTAAGTTATLVLGIDVNGSINDSAIAFAISENPCSVPLPVELANFEVSPVDNNWCEIKWQTVSETNNDYFTLEKSTDGRTFRPVETIIGAGNSSTLLSYSIQDADINSGTLYYRLIQTDFDGVSTVSAVRSVSFNSSLVSSIYPNPGNGVFEIALTESATIQVSDATGELILSREASKDLHQVIDLSDMDKGVYVITITNANAHEVHKWVKR